MSVTAYQITATLLFAYQVVQAVTKKDEIPHHGVIVTCFLRILFISFQSFTLHGRHVPILKMMKRQIRNFREGRNASITLVFRATMPVTVRWFRQSAKLNMGNSEVPNMIPVEG